MPAEKYTRFQAAPEFDYEDDEYSSNQSSHSFPNLDEFEVEHFDQENGGGNTTNGNWDSRIVTATSPKRRKFRGKQVLPHINGTEINTRTILIGALVCSACLCLGLVIGYVSSSPNSSHKSHQNDTKSYLAERQETKSGSGTFWKRDFTAATATHFESFLTNSVMDNYFMRLNRVPMSDIPSYISSAFRKQGLETKTVSFSGSVSVPDQEKPNRILVEYSDNSTAVINELLLSDGRLPYAAYSPAANVSGYVIYAHRGSSEDFDTLEKLGVRVNGSIVLIRHVTDSEAAQVMRAEAAGAIGVLLYPDPEEFKGNGSTYPNGTGLPEDGVILPTLKLIPGDPATISYPSVRFVYKKRMEELKNVLPRIPAQPISFHTAKIIITSLAGTPPPTAWIQRENNILHGLGGAWTKSSRFTHIRMEINNKIEERLITNVHAWLPCDDSTKIIHIGAAQANTGSAAVALASLLAIGRAMTQAQKSTGRRIMLSAWSESRFGFIGSTEFTELQRTWLEHTALAYLHIGPSVGSLGGLRVRGSPLLNEIIREASHQVAWPRQEALSVIEGWRMGGGKEYDHAFENLGCSSDAVSFTQTVGVPSVQFSVAQPMHPSTCKEGFCEVCYDSRPEHPLSWSQYDTYTSVSSILDPGLDWSTALASLVGASALVLSETPIPPVNFKGDFTAGLVDGWWSFLQNHLYALNHTSYNFTEILDGIRHELYELQSKMEAVSVWYRQKSSGTDAFHEFRHAEDRLNFFLEISRHLLGPRGIQRSFTTILVSPSDLVESTRHAPHSDNPKSNVNSTSIPSHILAIQTDEYFSHSKYNDLSFSKFYREDEKGRPHAVFPHVVESVKEALSGKGSFEKVHTELSILLSSLHSLRNFLPLN